MASWLAGCHHAREPAWRVIPKVNPEEAGPQSRGSRWTPASQKNVELVNAGSVRSIAEGRDCPLSCLAGEEQPGDMGGTSGLAPSVLGDDGVTL